MFRQISVQNPKSGYSYSPKIYIGYKAQNKLYNLKS